MKNGFAQMSHLIRPFNLLIIILTMYLLRWGLLKPMLVFVSGIVEMEVESQISEGLFGLLVLSVILIAAGGYIINDIKDVKTDILNKKPNPVGRLITTEKANLWYQITTISGLVLGFGVGYYLGNYNLGVIQLTAAISLWFYSNYFKTEFLVGNLIVAMVIALIPLTVGIYEVTLIQQTYLQKITLYKDFNFNFLAYWFMGYAGFVFLITLAREVLKDIEDLEGDHKVGAKTLPVQWGVKASLGLVTFLYVAIIYGLHLTRINFLTDDISAVFNWVILAFLIVHLGLSWAGKQILFKPSTWNKIISLIGVSYLIALGYIINNQLFFNV